MSWTHDSSEEIPAPRGKLSLYALADSKGAKFNRKDAATSSNSRTKNAVKKKEENGSQTSDSQEEEDSDKDSTEEGETSSEVAEEEEVEYWTGEPVVYERNSIISF